MNLFKPIKQQTTLDVENSTPLLETTTPKQIEEEEYDFFRIPPGL